MFREEIVGDAIGSRKHTVTHKTPQNHGVADFQRKFKERRGSLAWRKAAGVEPTQERLTPLTGFEVRPYHRIRMPSLGEKTDTYAVVSSQPLSGRRK